jgi:hypothetical protein
MSDVVVPRSMLASATKRTYRSAGRCISWREARRRGRAWCVAIITGEPVWPRKAGTEQGS